MHEARWSRTEIDTDNRKTRWRFSSNHFERKKRLTSVLRARAALLEHAAAPGQARAAPVEHPAPPGWLKPYP